MTNKTTEERRWAECLAIVKPNLNWVNNEIQTNGETKELVALQKVLEKLMNELLKPDNKTTEERAEKLYEKMNKLIEQVTA